MDYLGVVLSPNAVRSRWVQQELEMALTGQIETAQVKVIPILLRRCEIPGFLKGKKYVSSLGWGKRRDRAGSDNFDRSLRELVRATGVDPENTERWSGREMILVCDLRTRIEEHFAPRSVTVELFEDQSGINFIRVDNGDGTFQI
jgi:hypothetical protein